MKIFFYDLEELNDNYGGGTVTNKLQRAHLKAHLKFDYRFTAEDVEDIKTLILFIINNDTIVINDITTKIEGHIYNADTCELLVAIC